MEVAASLVTVGLLDRSRRLVAGIRRSSAELQEVYEEESDLTEDGVCAPRPRESQVCEQESRRLQTRVKSPPSRDVNVWL